MQKRAPFAVALAMLSVALLGLKSKPTMMHRSDVEALSLRVAQYLELFSAE
ncbi:uncharacterized protein RSE6_04426 [Rhynchosporium secalis]|uniref:Uncharacterized protein n=1 Tax=Rhynchosporium secalis TaxID=38038 RepID=A0A1E1M5A7_RHYSE|nr:uncharacterized protein RSE6_04426 [Rhynchosporium secalis]